MTVDEFFKGQPLSRQLFDALFAMVNQIAPAEIRVSKSQVAFVREKSFAMVWMPGMYLRGKVAPLVLTLVLRRRDTSPRWKEIVEPSPGNYTHHLELYELSDIDDQVRNWLWEAGLNRSSFQIPKI